MANTFGEG